MGPDLTQQLSALPLWLLALGYAAWAALVIVATPALFGLLGRLAVRAKSPLGGMVLRVARGPFRVVLLLVGAGVVLESSGLPEKVLHYGRPTIFTLISLVVLVFADRMVRALLAEYLPKSGAFEAGRSMIVGFARGLVIGIGILILLDSLGVPITTVLATLGVGSLAVALALQDTLGQFFAAIYVAVDQPVRLGDYIRLGGGEEGFVERIGWRSTRLRMLQNSLIVIPNSKLATSTITNFYLPEPEMSLPVSVSVAYGSDLEKVQRVTVEVAREVQSGVPGGVASFEPQVRFQKFDDGGIELNAILRVAQFTDQFLVRHEFIKRLHARFAEEGIVIRFPVRELRLAPEERALLSRGSAGA